jgi:hypothetical protein
VIGMADGSYLTAFAVVHDEEDELGTVVD